MLHRQGSLWGREGGKPGFRQCGEKARATRGTQAFRVQNLPDSLVGTGPHLVPKGHLHVPKCGQEYGLRKPLWLS